jgi:hypothetical protein
LKRLFLHGPFVLLALLSLSAFGQPTKEFSSFGWNVYSHSFGNTFGNFRNEAGLARFDHFTAGVLAEKRFMLKAASVYAFSIVLPVASGAFSLQGLGSGYRNFSRQRVAAAYGMPLASWLNAGMQLDYLQMHIPAYGNARAFTFGLSFLMHWKDRWVIGLQAFNPAEVSYNGLGDDGIPAVYRLGMGYQPSAAFFLSAELSKSGPLPLQVTAAFHYRIVKYLGIHGGVSTGEQRMFLGVSVFLEHFNMIFTAMSHPQLGMSPGAGFIYDRAGEHLSGKN